MVNRSCHAPEIARPEDHRYAIIIPRGTSIVTVVVLFKEAEQVMLSGRSEHDAVYSSALQSLPRSRYDLTV